MAFEKREGIFNRILLSCSCCSGKIAINSITCESLSALEIQTSTDHTMEKGIDIPFN